MNMLKEQKELFLIVNDKSINFRGNNKDSRLVIEKFIQTFAQITSKHEGKISSSLFSVMSLNDIMLNENYGFKVWRNQQVDIDLKRKFLSMCDREHIIPVNSADDLEISIDNYRDGALLIAYQKGYALLSFDSNDTWRKSFLEIRLDYVDDRPYETDELKNFYGPLNSEDLDWIDKLPKYEFIKHYPTPKSLLENLQSAFPNLLFHTKAQKQLAEEVQQSWYSALLARLVQLNAACEQMVNGNIKGLSFAPRSLTHESTETLNSYGKSHYSFTYNDKEYNIEYHLRYTGNVAGRIYFVSTDENKCIIYSLTSKLPTVSESKSLV